MEDYALETKREAGRLEGSPGATHPLDEQTQHSVMYQELRGWQAARDRMFARENAGLEVRLMASLLLWVVVDDDVAVVVVGCYAASASETV